MGASVRHYDFLAPNCAALTMLGAFEAAVIAGLIAFGMAPGPATSAVLIYRVLTFWLNVPLGWVGLRAAEKRGYV